MDSGLECVISSKRKHQSVLYIVSVLLSSGC